MKAGSGLKILVADLPMGEYSNIRTHTVDGQVVKRWGAKTHYASTMTVKEMCAMGSIVQDALADVCLGFFWATWPMHPQYMEVIEAWGFKPSTMAFMWVKTNRQRWATAGKMFRQLFIAHGEIGAQAGSPRPWSEGPLQRWLRGLIFNGGGHHTQANTEPCWLAIYKRKPGLTLKGANLRPAKGRKAQQVVIAPQTKHSRKPETVQDRIEWMYPQVNASERAEFFARRDRPGWACFGNEGVEALCGDIRKTLPKWAERSYDGSE